MMKRMITFPPALDAHSAADIALQLDQLLLDPMPIKLDMSAVKHIDTTGAAVLVRFARMATAQGHPYDVVGIQPSVRKMLELLPFPTAEEIAPAAMATSSRLERMGAGLAQVYDICIAYLLLCADVAWFCIAGLWQRRGIRWNNVVYEMAAIGSQALGVVGLISFLVGGTMALQAAAQLRQFGANIFIVDLVGVSITRELGPLITAIVVAGRSGSAIAAEIATMVITEEVDALRTMGLNPIRFLVVPKTIAIMIVQPLLTVWGNFLAIFGGTVVGVLYLEITPTAFFTRLQEALFMKDLLTGLFKSILFALIIATIGALCGMRTRGGADAVGRNTTTSVVAAIFAVIVADAACSLIFYFGG